MPLALARQVHCAGMIRGYDSASSLQTQNMSVVVAVVVVAVVVAVVVVVAAVAEVVV